MASSKKSGAAKKSPAGNEAFEAAETARNSAEDIVRTTSSAVSEFIENSSQEAQKFQDKALQMSRESSEQFAKSADSVSKAFQEMASLSREGAEACTECNNLTASFARDLSSETFNSVNRAFSDSMELSKDFLSCRTMSDMVELQNRFFQHSLDNFFSQSSKLSSMWFEFGSEAMEPLNERVASTTEKLQKVMAA